ncbi:MAG: sigma 54-interacting transcriptional regulator [Myxococcales bacterium]|nr:sigma 54-interacting transcriptional regulator [Myxococcales bacterium]
MRYTSSRRTFLRAADLHHSELLELDPEAGVIRFAGQRAVLLDAVAMGVLRNYLVENFGVTAARAVLTQFGFAHGWRMAEALKAQFDWDTVEDWRRAGAKLHTLSGLFHVDAARSNPLAKEGSVIVASYEAEQHLLHLGRSDTPVCWTICGLTSGYLSRVVGEEIFVLEDRCAAAGHSSCHLLGRTREDWGEERAEELRFFEQSRLSECLDVSLQRVVETLKGAEKRLREHRRVLVRIAAEDDDPSGLIARSAAMRRVVSLAHRVAAVDSTVLLTGESGAGKERIARLVHDASPRAEGPLVAVNCGAISETLLESELFGHVRGAFTGATHDRPGLFEAANGGTILLDEVGEVSAGMQVKLLRALQEREIRRVGDNKSRAIDVRVIAATNRDLASDVEAGTFRQDLYYRLRVVELHVPSLRERREDILPLARVLLAEAAARMKRNIREFTPAVADQLLRHSWPGNVRELENAMERAVALACGSRVELEDLPEEVREAMPGVSLDPNVVQSLASVEKAHILASLERNDGNQVRTARQLEIGSATLYRKLKSYGLIPYRAHAH